MTRLPVLVLLAAFAAGTACAGQTGPGIEERPAVTASAGGGGAAAGTAPAADISVTVFEQFQQFQAQIEALTGRVEQLEHDLQQSREQDRARYVDLDTRIKALEQGAKQRPADVAAVPTDTAPATTDDEKAQFDRALALVREKKFDDAISVFDQQLKQFPRGELAPVAMYWLGEMWLASSQPDAAKAGRYFYRVYNEYPKSSRASVAMYRHGMVQCQNDEVSKGRVTLSRVMTQYSGTPDARKAESALKEQCK